LVKNDDVMDLIVVFCILFVFMLVLYCFCVATEFSVNKDLYITIREELMSRINITLFLIRFVTSAHGDAAISRIRVLLV